MAYRCNASLTRFSVLGAVALPAWFGVVGCGSNPSAPPSGSAQAGSSAGGAPSTGSSGSGALTGGGPAQGGTGNTGNPGTSGSSATSGGTSSTGASGASSSGAGGTSTGGTSAAGAPAVPGGSGGPPTTYTSLPHQSVGAHDPAIGMDGGTYSLFVTGGRLSIRTSTDRIRWTNAGNIFTAVPAWISQAVGTAVTGLWAPDVSFFGGSYHVYYAGSVFGRNTSVIGLATNVTLNPNGAGYAWVDQGLIVQSTTNDDFNAIDPNVAFDATGQPWLSFGSFWDGIKMRRLDPATGKTSTTDTQLYSLASRNGGAIEAPSIISRNGFYYLFVSYDRCCQGVDSTYRTMVGRATSITGPYTNKAGAAMLQGNAEQLLASAGRYIGPGGGTAFRDGGSYWYVHHYYDGMANGASQLQIRVINWSADDWPTLGDPLWL